MYQFPASCAQELSFESDTAKASRKGGGLELHGISRKGGAATVLYQKQLAGDGLHKSASTRFNGWRCIARKAFFRRYRGGRRWGPQSEFMVRQVTR